MSSDGACPLEEELWESWLNWLLLHFFSLASSFSDLLFVSMVELSVAVLMMKKCDETWEIVQIFPWILHNNNHLIKAFTKLTVLCLNEYWGMSKFQELLSCKLLPFLWPCKTFPDIDNFCTKMAYYVVNQVIFCNEWFKS